MIGEVKIGEKTTKMKANGLTPVIYHAVFQEDLIDKMDHFGTQEAWTTIETAGKMAFIMMKQAKAKSRAELFELTEEQYYKWMETLGAMDMSNAAYDVIEMYMKQKKETATPKK